MAPDETVFGNVQVGRLRETMARAARDPATAVMEIHLAGSWNPDQGQAQYTGTLPTPGGPVEVKADFPPQFGGWGVAPSAIQYCLYASTACFLSTYGLAAALEGVAFRSLQVRCDARVNLARFLGAGEAPVIESMKWTVVADSDASDAQLQHLLELAEARCPATWCLRNPIPVKAEVTRSG